MLQTRPLLRLRLKNNSQEKLPPRIIPRANAAQKFFLLIRRDARLLWREKTVISMLGIPPLIALGDLVLAPAIRSEPDRAPLIFGMLVFLVLLTSALLVQNEIFKERAVYQYENRTKTLLFPYILSKVWQVGILAIYQGLVWTIMHVIATRMAEGSQILFPYCVTVILISFIGGLLGLAASALSTKAMRSTNWLLLFTVPQLIFSGSMIPGSDLTFPVNLLSGINPSRYALEALLTTSGYGESLASALLPDWFILVIISLCLIALLMGIQQRAGNTTT
jgi:ABC-type multidrug transport system permease subunit